MLTISSPSAMQRWSDDRRADGERIGLVPTMGALHAGHMALIAEAGDRCDKVVVSVFVNPLQFNEAADFAGYPRPIDDDVQACEDVGVDVVFAPTAADMYPPGFQTRVLPGALGDLMEGPGRPGHFEGVVTVVAKLFGCVRPHVSVFGQKDYQQLRIVSQMAADLDLGVEIIGHPIVREPDGLARSSRNVRLTTPQRAAAVVVPRSLDAAHAAARAGHNAARVLAAAAAEIDTEPLAAHEYTTIFDARTLDEVTNLDDVAAEPGHVRIATAVWFGDVRLIDNRDLFDD